MGCLRAQVSARPNMPEVTIDDLAAVGTVCNGTVLSAKFEMMLMATVHTADL